jgi:hypothetical protein
MIGWREIGHIPFTHKLFLFLSQVLAKIKYFGWDEH